MISVIIPVYNVEKYLKRCVESVLMQTYKDLEIILVDDGATDTSPQMCDEFAALDARIKVIHKSNGRVADARNKGIDAATGEYIGFVDGDDYIHPQMFEILLQTLRKTDADMSVCWFQKVTENQQITIERQACDEPKTYTAKEAMLTLAHGEPISVVPWNKLYKRELFKEIRYPVGKYIEDEFVIHHLLGACKRIGLVTNELYYYVQQDKSAMANVNEKGIVNTFEAFMNRYAYARKQHFPQLQCLVGEQYLHSMEHYLEIVTHLKKEDRTQITEMWKADMKEMIRMNEQDGVAFDPTWKLAAKNARLYHNIHRFRCNMGKMKRRILKK